jgi:D-glycero-alpha-D-manno-heptose-7-phosphate kinase
MIIVRSPLRITLGGGGTDLPSYYRDHGGFLIAAAIDKYVYITLHNTFQPGFIIKYSELERVERAVDIRYPIVRAAIQLVGTEDRIEIASMADIPAGSGLGSSGSFTTALLRALHTRRRDAQRRARW